MRNPNFSVDEIDILHSSYKMLMYREGYNYPNTYHSKKKRFDEPKDKEYLMLSMIERFVGVNNCFFRKKEELNGKNYSPATMLEFWRIFEDDAQERLVLRMFHPTNNVVPFELFDYLKENEKVKAKLMNCYELLRLGKVEAITISKPRTLELDEKQDFFWDKISAEQFAQHLAHLYSKYPARNRIDSYRDVYMNRHFYQAQPVNHNSRDELKQVWSKCLELIRSEVNETDFLKWFLPIEPISLSNKKLIIQVPSLIYYDWIEDNHVRLIRKILDQTIGKEGTLEYTIQNHKQ